jgi:predicted dithiol-disulfide oxidoreductase (DUF899 family)
MTVHFCSAGSSCLEDSRYHPGGFAMSLPDVVSREQWLEARRRLLAQEKEYTRQHDALNADRRRTTTVPNPSCSAPNGPPRCPASAASCARATRSFHTYSTYGRGTDHLVFTYGLLDLTALGRQEDWEEPKDRVAAVRGGDPTFTS